MGDTAVASATGALPASRRSLITGGAALAASFGLSSRAQPADLIPSSAAASPDLACQPGDPGAGPWTSEGWVTVGGGKIHWAEVGAGPTVVLLPKLGGWLADWRHVAPLLAKAHRVIAIDPPGHGESLMNGPPPFLLSQEESAGMIVKCLDTLGIDRWAMIGNSMGGSISLVAAVLWPQRVTRLAMISTALPSAVPLAEIVRTGDNRNQIYNHGVTYNEFYKLFGATRATYDDYVLSEAKAGAWKDPSERGVRRAGLLEYLARVDCPTLLIYGDRAGLGYQRYLPDIKQRRPDIPIERIPDSGTFTHQDNPEATARILMRFLAA